MSCLQPGNWLQSKSGFAKDRSLRQFQTVPRAGTRRRDVSDPITQGWGRAGRTRIDWQIVHRLIDWKIVHHLQE